MSFSSSQRRCWDGRATASRHGATGIGADLWAPDGGGVVFIWAKRPTPAEARSTSILRKPTIFKEDESIDAPHIQTQNSTPRGAVRTLQAPRKDSVSCGPTLVKILYQANLELTESQGSVAICGFCLTFCCSGRYRRSVRARRSSGPARPYIFRLSAFRRLICPSVSPGAIN